MPFRSQAQRAYMYANHPQLAKEFEEVTPKDASLPEHVAKMAYGGETNAKHETLKSMENNPTAGFAKGGEVTLGDEHPFLASMRDFLKSKDAPITKTDHALDEIDRLEKGPQASTDTTKGYAGGGDVPFNYPDTYMGEGKDLGVMDHGDLADSKIANMQEPDVATTRDNLEPGIMDDTTPPEMNSLKALNDIGQGFFAGKMGTGLAEGMSGLGEGGFASLGNAPKMEEPSDSGIDGIKVFVKGIQKGKDGAEMKYYGVEGKPEFLQKHFNDPAPATVPEAELRAKGFLPEVHNLKNPPNAPNGYAKGGEVMKKEINMFGGGDPSQQPPQQQPDFMSVLAKMLPVAASYAPGAMPNIEAGAMTSPALGQLAGSVLPQNLNPAQPMNSQPPQGQDTQFMNQLNQGTAIAPPTPPQQPPQQPSLNQAAQTAQNAPATNYDFYKNMSAEDRAALYQKLTQQQHSGGNLAASAIGGLGDAVSNAFGHGGQHTQQQIMANAEASKQGQLGAMDTERQQKMQDVQAKMTVMEGDPQSAYSQGMRQFYKQLMGVNAPSNMSAGMLKGMLPDLAKVFESKTQAAIQGGAQGIDAAKTSLGETWSDYLKSAFGLGGSEKAENYLENRISGSSGAHTTNFTHTTPSGIKYGVH